VLAAGIIVSQRPGEGDAGYVGRRLR